MTNCYDCCIPIDALLGTSMFNARKPEEHFLPHDILGMLTWFPKCVLATDPPLEPPGELLAQVFPWVEAEQVALEEREHKFGHPAHDIALCQFLSLLIWLWQVLLQDTVVLFMQNPTCPLFQSPLFHNPSFQQFAAASKSALAQAEEDMHLNIQNLPSQFAASIQGFMASIHLSQDVVREEFKQGLASMQDSADDLLGGCSWHAFNSKRASTSLDRVSLLFLLRPVNLTNMQLSSCCSCSPSSATTATTTAHWPFAASTATTTAILNLALLPPLLLLSC